MLRTVECGVSSYLRIWVLSGLVFLFFKWYCSIHTIFAPTTCNKRCSPQISWTPQRMTVSLLISTPINLFPRVLHTKWKGSSKLSQEMRCDPIGEGVAWEGILPPGIWIWHVAHAPSGILILARPDGHNMSQPENCWPVCNPQPWMGCLWVHEWPFN